jgi:ORF6N domain
MPSEQIGRSTLVLRAQRVILDSELARIYGVETRILNQAVKRNTERFPDDFRFPLSTAETAGSRSQSVTLMFQLSAAEWGALRSQIVISRSSEVASLTARAYHPIAPPSFRKSDPER